LVSGSGVEIVWDMGYEVWDMGCIE
jgi:hypothetical protein